MENHVDNTSIGDRMKRYELVTKGYVLPRTPVIIRVDGKAFHTFTKRLNDEVDPSCATGPSEKMHTVMSNVAYYVSRKMQNCVLAYTQSDEISFVLKDWETHETQQWFGGNIQKMASIAAAMTTAYFNYEWQQVFNVQPDGPDDVAMFDARVFMLPHEEVTNYLVWRQQDATRNSINFLGQMYFSHKQLQGKNVSQVQDMLMLDHEINWNDCDTWKKRGSCVIKRKKNIYAHVGGQVEAVNATKVWVIDDEIPIFTKDRDYIEQLLQVKEKDE